MRCAGELRAGIACADTAADQIAVAEQAIGQIRRELTAHVMVVLLQRPV